MSDLRFRPSAIESWPIERLVPYVGNARLHTDGQIAKLAASLARFGWTVPCLVDERGILIAGHGRLLAARSLGLAEVPVIRLAHLSDEDARAYRIADNRLTEIVGWDDELLATELEQLRADGVDLELLGFAEDELHRLFEGIHESGATEEEDEVPEPPSEAVTRPGDLWLLGPHRLLCGNATVLTDVEKILAGGHADMTFCDPPYNVDYRGGAGRKHDRSIANDALGEGFGQFLYDACVNIVALTKGAIYICMSSSELHTLREAFVAAGGHWSTFIIWAKDRFTLGRSDYQRQYEPMLYGWREGAEHYWCGARDQGDVWFVDRGGRNDLHPTMKPVELVERAIKNSSRRGDLVLDPFGGSGTTLVASVKAARRSCLLELDPRYCDVIVRRWQALTAEAAILESTGERFDVAGSAALQTVAAERT